MPRPASIEKNSLSRAIVQLREQLQPPRLSQQAFSNLLGVALNTVQRWELNVPPSRAMLKRLVEIAIANDLQDIADVLYREYEQAYSLATVSPLVRHLDTGLDTVLHLLRGVTPPADRQERAAFFAAKDTLSALRRLIQEQLPGEPLPVKVRKKRERK